MGKGKRKTLDQKQSLPADENEDEEVEPETNESGQVKKKKKRVKSLNEEESPILAPPAPDVKVRKKKSKEDSYYEKPEKEMGDSKVDVCDDIPRAREDRPFNPDLISDDRLHTLIPKLMPMNQEDHELVEKEGIEIKSGRFNSIENAILQRNWKRYLEDYNVPNQALLFGHFQYDKNDIFSKQTKKTYQDFAKETNLWLRLAKDLPNRTLYQIYCKARFFLPDLKGSKDLTEVDRQMILDLYRLHGDRFANFCAEHGFNPKTAREIVRNTIKADGTQLKRGEWTSDEIRKLRKVVQKLVNELKLESYERIPWSRVARKLKRSDVQCRQRFFSKAIFSMISPADSNSGTADWNDKLDIAKFIALLKHLNYADQNLIDWDFIKEKFSSAYFNLLLRKWRELKIRIPDYEQMTLPEIVDYLYKKRVVKVFKGDPEKMDEIEKFVHS